MFEPTPSQKAALDLIDVIRFKVAEQKARVEQWKDEEVKAVNFLDPELFPQARNSYSCDECKAGKHGTCRRRIYAAQGDTWSAPCTCYETAKDFHPKG